MDHPFGNFFTTKPRARLRAIALLKKLARGVLGLRGVTARGVLWQHTRVFS